VVFVAATWLGAGLLAATVMRWGGGDWAAAAVSGPLVAAMAAYAIPSFGGIEGRWSASGFFHLAFSFAIGPPAILVMAVGQAAGSAVRRRPGAFRTIFNVGNHFLADTAAWLVFRAVGSGSGVIGLALGGAGGAVAETIVNLSLLGAVVSLAGEPSELRTWLRNLVRTASIALLFGITAAGATLLYKIEGTFGILTLLLPLALVQGSMVTLARRAHEHALAEEAQRREREGLLRREAQALRRAGDASEVERKRIAADLHDSVIQDVSGLLFRSSAMLGRLSDGDPSISSREGVETFLTYTRDLAAEAVRELRTLMVELAPPLLDEEGLSSALRQLLSRLDRDHISWVLECTEEPLDHRQQRLAYRVIQEALRNVVKHAQCHTVWVTVRTEGDRLLVSIRDDGRGFSAAERAEQRKKGHAGLGLLAQTARDGGGELSVTSARGKGTRVEMSVPMLPAPIAEETIEGDGATAAALPSSYPGVDGQVGKAGAVGGGLETSTPEARGARPRKPRSPTPAASRR
jgi:signal transduction histidine kinase